MTKSIICDLCGPLIGIDVRIIDIYFHRLGVLHPAPYYELCRLGIVDLADRGLLKPEEFRDRVRKVLDTPLTDYQVDTAWNSLTTGVKRRNLLFMQKLRHQGYNTFILSNSDLINAPYFNGYIEQEMGAGFLTDAFNNVYYSSDDCLHLKKPDPDIFRRILNLNNLQAKETIFVDDTEQHILGARKVGLRTMLMRV